MDDTKEKPTPEKKQKKLKVKKVSQEAIKLEFQLAELLQDSKKTYNPNKEETQAKNRSSIK